MGSCCCGARECGKEPRSEEEARRWRAYLTVDEEYEPEEVAIHCPTAPSGRFGRS
jgi:hypothetical protein